MTTTGFTPMDYQSKRTEYFALDRRDVIALMPSGIHRLLDVGCAAGSFGGRVKDTMPGIEVWGIEPEAAAAELAGARLDRVICGSVEQALADLPDGYFDCVTFNDVLEHLVDPWNVLRAVRPKIGPRGRVVASIPNIRHLTVMRELLFERDFRYRSEGVLDSTHLRFFTKKSMQRLFEESGYRVDRIDGLRWQKLPFAMRLVNGLTRGAVEDMRYQQHAVQATPASSGADEAVTSEGHEAA